MWQSKIPIPTFLASVQGLCFFFFFCAIRLYWQHATHRLFAGKNLPLRAEASLQCDIMSCNFWLWVMQCKTSCAVVGLCVLSQVCVSLVSSVLWEQRYESVCSGLSLLRSMPVMDRSDSVLPNLS